MKRIYKIATWLHGHMVKKAIQPASPKLQRGEPFSHSAIPRGFTLIELMVVIVIIGILSSIGFSSFSSARAKANDARRRADLKAIQNALEAYFNDNGHYPVSVASSACTATSGGDWISSEPGDLRPNIADPNPWIPCLTSQYISRIPRDPSGGTGHPSAQGCDVWKEAYLYKSVDGSEYALLAHCSIQAAKMNNPADTLYDPVRPNHAWKVCTGVTGCAY